MPPRKAKDEKAAREASLAANAAVLTVTAQQSRFHTELDEDNNLKEIVVKDLGISIANRELLSHANFQLQRGRHYVLHGRNGVGKSTLLRAIGTNRIPSIPSGVSILLLGQTQADLGDDGGTQSDAENVTVLDYVVQSNRKRLILLREAAVLSSALESGSDSMATVRALWEISHGRLERKVEDARRVAERRSGARGKEASKVLLRLEDELAASELKQSRNATPDDMTDEVQKAAELLAEVHASLEMMDAAGAEAKARAVLLGLGFSKASLDQPRTQLSGGWRTRCSLACALCKPVDLLLLDEPTNFLDLPSIIWLERYIQGMDSSTTIIIVTHDRSFADEVADELLVLREKQLERFRGNLSAYESDRLKQYKYFSKMKASQEKQKQHIQSTIKGNIQAAKRAGDDKKLKQAVSRKKKLDERMGMEVSAKGTRFKLNRDYAGSHLTYRGEIEVPMFDPPAQMSIHGQPSDLRFPGSLASLEKAGFIYSTNGEQKCILSDIDLTIHMGDRIGIAGLNGSGKSTLVSLVMGRGVSGDAFEPSFGTVSRHTRAKFAVYSQQAAEELEVIATAKPELTALRHLMDSIGPDAGEQDTRAVLSGMGLVGRIASDVPISLLSGGQRVRLALSKIMCSPPHLLVLDEVTTHLDTDTIQALVAALKSYEGAILVVTHDRFFMRTVVEGVSAKDLAAISRPDHDGSEDDDSSGDDEHEEARTRVVYHLSKGRLVELERGMEQYEEIAARSATLLDNT